MKSIKPIEFITKKHREKPVENYVVKLIDGIHIDALALKFDPKWFAGMTDRILLCPTAIIVFCETKKPKGGAISPRQKLVQAQLTRLGFIVRNVKNKAEAQELKIFIEARIIANQMLNTYGIPGKATR